MQHQQDEFEVDINNFKVLGKDQDGKEQRNGTQNSSPQQESPDTKNASMSSPEHQQPDPSSLQQEQPPGNNVQNIEDDGSGFFITGINTHGGDAQEMPMEAQIQPIEEEADPADSYKHVAVVDCSKAFSNQEVGIFAILFIN